jgi:hypothetical protein
MERKLSRAHLRIGIFPLCLFGPLNADKKHNNILENQGMAHPETHSRVLEGNKKVFTREVGGCCDQ